MSTPSAPEIHISNHNHRPLDCDSGLHKFPLGSIAGGAFPLILFLSIAYAALLRLILPRCTLLDRLQFVHPFLLPLFHRFSLRPVIFPRHILCFFATTAFAAAFFYNKEPPAKPAVFLIHPHNSLSIFPISALILILHQKDFFLLQR